MDIAWNCPQCRQELSADTADAGQEIQCPTCGETQPVPEPKPEPMKLPVPTHVHSPSKPPSLSPGPAEAPEDYVPVEFLQLPPLSPEPAGAPAAVPASAPAEPAPAAPAEAPPAETAAAAATPAAPEAKPEPKHEHKTYSVRQHEGPAEKLVKKKAEAESSGPKEKRLRIRCIKRHQCEEVGHDKFEQVVDAFLQKTGEENVVSITPVGYGVVNTIGQTLNDYGVLIVYHG